MANTGHKKDFFNIKIYKPFVVSSSMSGISKDPIVDEVVGKLTGNGSESSSTKNWEDVVTTKNNRDFETKLPGNGEIDGGKYQGSPNQTEQISSSFLNFPYGTFCQHRLPRNPRKIRLQFQIARFLGIRVFHILVPSMFQNKVFRTWKSCLPKQALFYRLHLHHMVPLDQGIIPHSGS